MLRIAAPAVVMQSLSSFMSLGLNQLLTLWSQTGVFVLGVYFKIQTFVFMPIFGVSNGLIPILSYTGSAWLWRWVSGWGVRFCCVWPPRPCCGTASRRGSRRRPWGSPP